MNRTTSRLLACSMTLAGGTLNLLGGCATSAPTDPAEHVGAADEELTGLQCLVYSLNGSTTICHATGSTKHPYTIVKTSVQACINGHSNHVQDYIAVGDPTCQGGGCVPPLGPCDATLPCCSGGTCVLGVCIATCTPNTCEAQGKACGTTTDGCGDTLDCNHVCEDGGGTCASDNTCSCPILSGYDPECATNAWDEAAQECELSFAAAGTVCTVSELYPGECDGAGICNTIPPNFTY